MVCAAKAMDDIATGKKTKPCDFEGHRSIKRTLLSIA